MSPLLKHERYHLRLRRMVDILTEELDFPMMSVGSTTLLIARTSRLDSRRMSLSISDDLSRILAIEYLNMEVDPPPDLAIEIEITPSALNRLGIYGGAGCSGDLEV